jgi:glycerol-3-phosphate dehydrogenase (NAD(P)+)
MQISILGAGNWGTTMALLLHKAGHAVVLWEYDGAQAKRVQHERVNERFLPDHRIPEEVAITSDLQAALSGTEMLLLAVPVQSCRGVLRAIGILPQSVLVASLQKGLEQSTEKRISQICADELREFAVNNYAVISGPTIAREVADGKPTSAVVASVSDSTAERIQREFSNSTLRLYRSADVTGVELAGALKNVIALAAGMCDGMRFGFNTKGALITRGLAEIGRLGIMLGGQRQTFSGLSGLGDLVTTCTSPQSRNHTVGERIGRGESPKAVLASMVMVAEGVWTARAARSLAQKHGLDMPITEVVCRILDEEVSPLQAVPQLMLRSLKAED